MFDARPSYTQNEATRYGNPLKKAKNAKRIRNLTEHLEQARKAAMWPTHKTVPHRVVNMHESGQQRQGG